MTNKIELIDLPLKDAFLIKPFKQKDERGFFYKMYVEEELLKRNIKPYFSEEFFSISKKNVIRGFHYQAGQYSEAKLVNCIIGKVYDVIIDLRKGSPTFGKWMAVELSEQNNYMLYIPKGFAHGFIALSEKAYMIYRVDNKYCSEYARGIIYNDPYLNIPWPNTGRIIVSEKDRKWPEFKDCEKFE